MNKVYTIYYFLFINRSQTNFSYLFYLANFFCFLIHKQNKSIKKPKAFIFFLYFVKRCIIGYKSVFLPSKASMLCIQLLTSYIAPTTKHRGTFVSLFSALFCLTSLISHHLSLMTLSWFHLGKLIFKLFLENKVITSISRSGQNISHFSGLAFIACGSAFAAFFLPETRGIHLPEKWEDIIEVHKVKPKSYFEFQEVSAFGKLKRLWKNSLV